MNAKRAKRLRKALVPGRSVSGISRGRLMRELTKYDRTIHRRLSVAWPLQELFGPIQIDYYTLRNIPDSPRGMYRKFKRKYNEHRARS